MSFEAYKIAVKLSLVNSVSSGLASLSREFIGLQQKIDGSNKGLLDLERRMASIKRMTLIGGAMAGAGFGMLFSLKGPIEQAMEYERELAKLRQMGLGNQQIEEARKFVQATNIIGTSMQQRMKLFTEAQGSFRESGMSGASALEAAKVMMPVLAQYQLATSMLGGKNHGAAEQAMLSLNKTVEMLGGLNSPQRASEIAEGVFKAVQASGRMVSERDMKQFVAMGGPAVRNLSLETIFAGLEPIIGELGGSSVGTGIQTAHRYLHGIMSKPPKLMVNEMLRLGIWDRSMLTFNSQGGIKSMRGDPLVGPLASLEGNNVIEFAQRMLQVYRAKGITKDADIARENDIIFGRTGSRVYTLIMKQMEVIQRSLQAYRGTKGMAGVIEDEKDGPLGATEKFKAALADLGLVIGQTVLPVLTPMVKDLAALFRALGEHPMLLKALTYGFTALASAMAIGGTVMLATGAFQALGLAIGVAGSGGLVGALTGVLGPLGLVIGLLTTLGLIASQAAKGHEWDQHVGGPGHKNFAMRGALYNMGAGGGRGFVNPGMPGQAGQNVTVQIDGEDVRHRILNNTPASPARGLQGLNPRHSPLSPGLSAVPGQ